MDTPHSTPAPPASSPPAALPAARPRVRQRNRLADYPPVAAQRDAVPDTETDNASDGAAPTVASASPAPDAIGFPAAGLRPPSQQAPSHQANEPPLPDHPEPAPATAPAPEPAPPRPALPAARADAGSNEDKAGRDYAVGYGKPPRHSRFKPGQSGNPAGRPKGAKGVNTIVREAMTRKVQVRTAQGTTKMTRAEVMIEKAIELAMKGDPRALTQMLARYAVAVPDVPAGETDAPGEDMTETDHAMLEALRLSLADHAPAARDEAMGAALGQGAEAGAYADPDRSAGAAPPTLPERTGGSEPEGPEYNAPEAACATHPDLPGDVTASIGEIRHAGSANSCDHAGGSAQPAAITRASAEPGSISDWDRSL